MRKLYEIICDTDGIYRGSFSGAGFNGCCMALIPAYEESIIPKVSRDYLKEFPQLEGKYGAHICVSAAGAIL